MPSFFRRHARALAIGFAALAFGSAGCETAKHTGAKVLYGINPVGSADATVLGVSRHGPYLIASFAGPLEGLRMVAPATESCLQMLVPSAPVNYAKSGIFGRLSHEAATCDLVGVASLEAWRDRQPRRRSNPPVPRATARFRPLQKDADFLFLRGRFPLVGRVFIPDGIDYVALLPNTASCQSAAARGDTSMEFRPAGPEPFVLLSEGAPCPIAGFALPAEAAPKG
jgi:hypothetical protein